MEPNTVPSGMPLVTGSHLESCPLSKTRCFLPETIFNTRNQVVSQASGFQFLEKSFVRNLVEGLLKVEVDNITVDVIIPISVNIPEKIQ